MSHPIPTRVALDALPAVRGRRLGVDGTVTVLLLLAAAACPPLFHQFEDQFWPNLLNRAMILAIAASSLNLLVGLGGLVSFGHAVYLGIGAYAVGIAAASGISDGLTQLAIAVLASAGFALLSGVVALKTRGTHFIMLTMAFAQMAYFLMVGLRQYGGDDGLTLDSRSLFPAPIDLENAATMYYATLVLLAAIVLFGACLKASRFGLIVMASKGSERRVRTQGFNPVPYRLALYVAAGMLCGIAGFLQANLSTFITPAMMSWTQSGELLFMIILGGTGAIAGPLLGALLFVLIQELLGSITSYWTLYFGFGLVAVALYGKGGLMGQIMRGGPR